MPGTLFIVATPIGNLEDITFRAVRVLREVDLIACEDTRQTRKLLAHYAIGTPLVSYHEHNEAERAAELVERLSSGASVALVSDAGTPLVSDPGFRLVRAAIDASIRVEPVPGASAMVAALSASGLASDAFVFAGFPPSRSSQRRKSLQRWKEAAATIILYEAPHRTRECLEDILAVLGDREIVLARELTKVHEEFLRGTVSELLALLSSQQAWKGEVTILVARRNSPAAPPAQPPEGREAAMRECMEECLSAGMSRMEAIKSVARRFGLSKRDVYRQFG